MDNDSKIYVAGHRGLVGSAIIRKLKESGYSNLVCRAHEELDLERQANVEEFFERQRPQYVFLAAAKVGGILANNTYPADFVYNNLMIQSNIIHSSYLFGVKKLLFLGSSCIYPKFAPQPIKEEYLLEGKLEPTNEPYAVAKIAGIKMCQAYDRQYGTNFISVMPTNTYGPNDNFDLQNAHVLPALIRKFHEAKVNNSPQVELWGTGTARREFIFVDDLADACVFLMNNYDDPEIVNIGVEKDVSIKELGLLIKEITGYKGKLIFNTSKPEGTPQKLLDVKKLYRLGWRPQTSLRDGIRQTFEWFVNEKNTIRKVIEKG